MRRRSRRQAGVSLIELLITLVIGLLVTVAAVASMVHTRVAAAMVGESARLHHDAASALRLIEHHVRQAGARGLRSVPGGGTVEFIPDTDTDSPDDGPRVVDGTQGSGSRPDTLRVGLDNDTSILASDCLGNPPASDKRVLSLFELVDGSLRCKGSGHENPAPLIEGVEDFQVRYAVREDDRLQYQDNPSDWRRVQGVMVCLRLVGHARAPLQGAGLKGCRNETVADDGRMRRVFVRVIHIRNELP